MPADYPRKTTAGKRQGLHYSPICADRHHIHLAKSDPAHIENASAQGRIREDGLIYGASLREALTRFYPPYEAIGIRNAGGDYNQLSTSLLQIENEFYGTIRPKRVIFPGERPL
jgi:gamma-glutamylcysteine synthetase